MLFRQEHLDGIKSGHVSLAFRKWNKPVVKAGSQIKTSVGVIEITSVTPYKLKLLSMNDAVQAGFPDITSLKKELEKNSGAQLYKLQVRYQAADPRIALRENTALLPAGWEAITQQLERLDKYSRSGPWTQEVLQLIRHYPEQRAADLAEKINREKEWLKLNIRKLKNMGLTISHETGYSLSPLGIAYLEQQMAAGKS
ncbi:hypothetical protein [Chitinophaga sp. 212800010-3]|uniref:hypothetical protein n=1 Tax=unclassified Chitinophaga TaxID=2619133 RepID=UPI002DF38933|nr:ASCH domain-containing protein [Chitinophaga sp. 212800010-3]